ncbi:MAG: hypothetical protein KF729_07070 [Sandaracinaceae bacterium]|nr:hypothetical protein [Sandaracinaceae bacterium]
MASFRREHVIASALAFGLGCSVGGGEGSLGGAVSAPDCDVDVADYQLTPSFFSGEVTGAQLDLRIQRGSAIESDADGLMVQILDVNEVFQSRIGIPIPISPSERALLRAVLYLNETCKAGFPDFFDQRPLIMEAQSGAIVFSAVYAPDLDAGATLIAGELVDVRFSDHEQPDRSAALSGTFSFFYQRGSPAQRF